MTQKEKMQRIIHALHHLFPHPKIALQASNPWELLVAVILSAQCTDKKVNEVTAKLFKKYPNLEDYVKADPKAFEKDIHSTGFYKNKTKNILAAAKMIQEVHHGKIPQTMEELIQIPGVGRKTANVILGNKEGIAVDTHVTRLAKLFGLTKHTNAEKIEQDLIEITPQKEWKDITFLFIEYGRVYCTARCKHTDCPLREYIV